MIEIFGVSNNPKLNNMLGIEGVKFSEANLQDVLRKLYQTSSFSLDQLDLMRNQVKSLSSAMEKLQQQNVEDITVKDLLN